MDFALTEEQTAIFDMAHAFGQENIAPHARQWESMGTIPKTLWPVPLEFLEGMPLENWTPQSIVDRCIMLRVNDDPVPCFVAPAGYPERRDS